MKRENENIQKHANKKGHIVTREIARIIYYNPTNL